MLPLLQILSAQSTAETVEKSSEIVTKLKSLSSMSLGDIIDSVIKGTITFGFKIALAIFLFVVGKWIISKVESLMVKIMEKRKVDLSLRTFLESLVKITMMIILLIIIIGILGINTSSFLALFASAGVAVGMALSGTLQNFAGGVMILLFKPYEVGDFIEAQGQIGTVKQIQIINTVLNTVDNKAIIIPNGSLSTGIINNYSKEGIRRIDWTFGIAYGNDYDQAKKLILELISEDKRIFTSPAPFVALSSLGESSVNITVRVWANLSDYWDIFFELNEKVYKRFPEKGLNIPFPQMDVHLYNTPNT
ncbi:MAG: mechanosensitive ion channel [Bacteroidales bacterium]|nr:mechanosensitive ion channel [Bacteroidales bacterium]